MSIFLRLALNISVKLKETEVSDMFFYFTSRIASDFHFPIILQSSSQSLK